MRLWNWLSRLHFHKWIDYSVSKRRMPLRECSICGKVQTYSSYLGEWGDPV